MKRLLAFGLVLQLGLPSSFFGQTIPDLQPGKERWAVKIMATGFDSRKTVKSVKLKKLLTLGLLDKKYSKDEYDSILIPQKRGTLKEGDMISTIGYLHLVALERDYEKHRDGDYHIQLTLRPEWGDSCFIVEIPFEDFTADTALKRRCAENRKWIRRELLHDENKQPTTKGNVMDSIVYVKVTGQLFYDASHAEAMRKPNASPRAFRGKKGRMDQEMHSYTAWEIHPVTGIEFVAQPEK